jgi:hypothetical protein
MKLLKLAILASVAAMAVSVAPARADENVEVLHWWTSGGEAAALDVLNAAMTTPRSGKMTEAFGRMEKLRSYVDENFSGRDRNPVFVMGIKGKGSIPARPEV